MSIEEENKALVTRFYDLDNQRDKYAQYELVSPQCIFHLPDSDLSLKEFRKFDASFSEGFPDIHACIEEFIAEGDMVAVRLTFRGTNSGKVFGNPPTGEKLEISHTNWFRIRDGRIIEYWNTNK